MSVIRGAPVDIVTGLPVVGTRSSVARQKAVEGALIDKMAAAGLTESAAHRMVIEEVENVLAGIVAAFLDKNERAQTCIEILRKLGGREVSARDAARRYLRMKAAGGAPRGDVRGEATTQQAGPS